MTSVPYPFRSRMAKVHLRGAAEGSTSALSSRSAVLLALPCSPWGSNTGYGPVGLRAHFKTLARGMMALEEAEGYAASIALLGRALVSPNTSSGGFEMRS